MYIVHMSVCLSFSRYFHSDRKVRFDSSRFSPSIFFAGGEIFGGSPQFAQRLLFQITFKVIAICGNYLLSNISRSK